jgi:hypothetical protein
VVAALLVEAAGDRVGQIARRRLPRLVLVEREAGRAPP